MIPNNYAVHSPERISSNIAAITRKRLVQRIITPIIFHSEDDKMLFVGDLPNRLLKIPNQLTDLSRSDATFDLDDKVKQLAGFCFRNTGGITQVDYLGLIRHKAQDRSLIVPVVAVLDETSGSPWLEPSELWKENALSNRDQLWADTDECQQMINGCDSDMLTENTAGIVDYFQRTKVLAN